MCVKDNFRRGAPLACALMVAAFSCPAFAQSGADKAVTKGTTSSAVPAKMDAKASFSAAEKKFKGGDFAGALADFEAANMAKPTPEVQRYIALSNDRLERFSEAAAAYEAFVALNPPSMKAEVEEARKRVDVLHAMPGRVHIETNPPGASVVLDGAQAPVANTTPTDLELNVGKHTLLMGAEGYENVSREVDVTFGSKQDLKLDLVKKVEPVAVAEAPVEKAAPSEPRPEPRSKVPAFVTGGVAVVAAGIGTIFGVKALSAQSDFDKAPSTSRADDGENDALVADMMFGIAITFGVTSAVLFLSDDAPASAKASPGISTARAKSPQPKIHYAPYVTTHGGGASALVRF